MNVAEIVRADAELSAKERKPVSSCRFKKQWKTLWLRTFENCQQMDLFQESSAQENTQGQFTQILRD